MLINECEQALIQFVPLILDVKRFATGLKIRYKAIQSCI
jgi:hypothetical protein